MIRKKFLACVTALSMLMTACVSALPAMAANDSDVDDVVSSAVERGLVFQYNESSSNETTKVVDIYYTGIDLVLGGNVKVDFSASDVVTKAEFTPADSRIKVYSDNLASDSYLFVASTGDDLEATDNKLFGTLTFTVPENTLTFDMSLDTEYTNLTDGNFSEVRDLDATEIEIPGLTPPTLEPTVAPTLKPVERGLVFQYNESSSSETAKVIDIYYTGIDLVLGGNVKVDFSVSDVVTKAEFTPADSRVKVYSDNLASDSYLFVASTGDDLEATDNKLFGTLTLTVPEDTESFIMSLDTEYTNLTDGNYSEVRDLDPTEITIPGAVVPTEGPTEEPSTEPTEAPSEEPTVEPTATPEVPDVTTAEPKPFQTPAPTVEPTTAPTLGPDETEAPTVEPTTAPAQAEVGLKDVVGDKVTDEYDGKTLNSLVVNVTTADGDPAVYGEDFVAVYDSRELSEDEYNNLINGYTYDPDTNTFTETQASAEALQSVIDGLIIKGNVGIDVKAGAGYGSSVAGEAKTTDPVTEVVYPSSESVLGSVKVTVTTPEGTTVTIKRNGVTLDPDEDAILVGDELELTFSGTGYDFTKWTIDGATLADSSEATDTTVTIVVDDDVQTLGITANATAAAGQIIVKISSPTSGKITVKDGDTTITSGDTVEVGTELSVACTGYSSSYNFSSWTASPSGVGSFDTKSSPSTTFTISDTTTASTVTIGASLTKRSSSSGSSSGSSGSSSGGTGVIAGGSGSSSSSSGSTSSSTGFEDLGSVEWAVPAINALAKLGIINGRSDTIFDPNASVTRAEFIKMACAAFGVSSTPDASQTFTDVSPSDWFYGYVEAGVAAGITNGVSDTEFDPNATITREQMATMLNRALNAKSMTLSATTTKTFDDADQISDYAVESVTTLANAGVIKGVTDTEFQPQELATRAQAAALIYQLYQALGMTTSN